MIPNLRTAALAIMSLSILSTGCAGCDPEPGPDMGAPDAGVDMPRDMPDAQGDSGDDVGPDVQPDLDPDATGDMGEDMPDLGPSTCPGDLRDSCLFDVFSCFGGEDMVDQCVEDARLRIIRSQLNNGARVQYQSFEINGQIQREFTTFDAAGDRCFTSNAQETGESPSAWSVESRQGFRYQISFTPDEVRVVCADTSVEICSRTKFDLFFAWPDDAPTQCEPQATGMDQCAFDEDCGAGTLCCKPDANSPRQCLGEGICLNQRAPKPCKFDDECAQGETCAKCRNANRECVPMGFDADPANALGCVPDECAPDDGSCQEPRSCCIVGGSQKCSAPAECDEPPQINPICNASDVQSCVNPTQQCCYIQQLSQYRCIDQSASCLTNVCFSNTDCASGLECCGANAGLNIPGSCLSECDPGPLLCQTDNDCSSINGVCCLLPGYTNGECGADQGACRYLSCQNDASACTANETCCGASPLTEAVCIPNGSACPPTL